MPGVQTTGSTNIAILDSRIISDLCSGLFCIDITPSIWIGDGKENVLGANFQILNPYNVVIKDYEDDYEIAPALSGGMDAAVCFPIPTSGGTFQYGQYTFNAKLYDSDGKSWVVSKTFKICEPDKKNKTRNYGSLSALMKVNCVAGKLFIVVDSTPNYNGAVVESQVLAGSLEYPTGSELPPLSFNSGNFSVRLFEGVYKLTGEICATYNYGDNVYAKVKYKIKKEHNARCLIDECCVFAKLSELHLLIQANCTDEERQRTASITVDALRLLETAKLAAKCGEDPSPYIDELEQLLNCKCTCNCSEGSPIIQNEPSGDVIIEGCNVTVETNGNTKTYTIENYDYEIAVTNNGGVLIVSAVGVNNCKKTQQLTFNISAAYSQIKTLANQNNTEADFWGAIINKSLRNVDPLCLGLTNEQWQGKTFPQKIVSIIEKVCSCCGTCDATILNPTIESIGDDVKVTWEGAAHIYEIYLDGELYTTILTSHWPNDTYYVLFEGAADGAEHTYLIVSRCSDKGVGQTYTASFMYFGCPEISSVIFNNETTLNVACPFDLTSIIDGSNPYTVEWHTANNTKQSTLVTNPAAVGGGNYWAFNKSGDCYSPGKKVTVLCSSEASCTAPQNMYVWRPFFHNVVNFQSAAYPPPGNSYTVKRRLLSDPDVGGSYVTIGNAIWSPALNRWYVNDLTAENDREYVYRAISNCGSTEPSIDYLFVNATCNAPTLNPTATTVEYSFIPLRTDLTDITQIKIQIWDSTGTVLIHTDTHIPTISDEPVTGVFEYLTPNTTYKVRLVLKYGSITKNCNFYTVTTEDDIL